MKPFKLTPEEILALKDKLPRGAISKIAKELNITRSYVSAVMNDIYPYNQKIIKAALDLVEESKTEDKEIRERFDKLNQSKIA